MILAIFEVAKAPLNSTYALRELEVPLCGHRMLLLGIYVSYQSGAACALLLSITQYAYAGHTSSDQFTGVEGFGDVIVCSS